MHVWTLRGILVRSGRLFCDLYIKADGQRFWREALGIVAGLIAQHAVHHIFSGSDCVERMHRDVDGEVPAVDAELFIRRKRKREILAFGILDFAEDDVSRQIHLQRGWDQEFRSRHVRVDVESRGDAEIQRNHGLRGALCSYQSDRNHRNGRSLAGLRERRARKQGEECNECRVGSWRNHALAVHGLATPERQINSRGNATSFLLSIVSLQRLRGRVSALGAGLCVQRLFDGILNVGAALQADDAVDDFAVAADEETLR